MQWDGGQTTDSPRGTLAATTLRKLPIVAPKANAEAIRNQAGA
jgi:hypothetical protein